MKKIKKAFVTTSWDDGYPLDLRLAELLKKYNLPATFYLPSTNQERPTMGKSEIHSLASGFEIGCHSRTHVDLTAMPSGQAQKEILESKFGLEEILQKGIKMFCYPLGKFNTNLIEIIQKASFIGARTVNMFNLSFPRDPFLFHPTIQVYNHRKWVYTVKALTAGRPEIFPLCLSRRPPSWINFARFLFDQVAVSGGLWHLWGHSWEIDNLGLWNELEDLFKYVAGRDNVGYIDNSTAVGLFKNSRPSQGTN